MTVPSVLPRSANARGASLIEAIVASALVITMTAGVAHLLVWARRAAWSAGTGRAAVSMAAQKMEQLRAIPWHLDAGGAVVSDATTDLAHDPPRAGGTGLQPSPGGALERNTPGFVDYLDGDGRWCGTGVRPPPAAAFVRRWAIQPFPPDAADTIVFVVVVQAVADAAMGAAARDRAVRLRTIRTRVAQ